MKLPSSGLQIWGIALIGCAAYLSTQLIKSEPQVRLVLGGIAALLFIIGILVLIRFHWSPELVAAVAVFMIAWTVVHTLSGGLTIGRVGICVGAIFVLVSYPTIRSDVRNSAQHVDGPSE